MRYEVLGQVAARLAALAAAAVALSCSSSSPPAVTPSITIARSPSDQELEVRREDLSSPRPLGARGVLCRAPSSSAVIAWETDERDARERARRRGLPLLLYARADWSAASLEMERRAWADLDVAAASRCFVALKLDLTSAEGDAELYAERYGIPRVPSTLILEASGRAIAILAGEASSSALLSAMERALLH